VQDRKSFGNLLFCAVFGTLALKLWADIIAQAWPNFWVWWSNGR